MKFTFDRISVIGLGYIGLPTAAVIASRGKEVIGVDVNQKAVDTINQGQIHIVEPELDIAVHSAVNSGKLRAVTRPERADAFLVAVPTPFDGDHRPDLSYIKAAAESIAPVLEKGNLVVLESTSPIGATEKMVEWLAAKRPDLSFPNRLGKEADVYVAHCPERVLPGQVLRELVENDRVIGGMTEVCSEAAKALYRIFVAGELLVTDARTAEMAKLTENAFRDVNIAFANELSIVCDQESINVWELIDLANHHPRVNILQPGPGVGGHCIAVDPWFIIYSARESTPLMQAARHVNGSKPDFVLKKINQSIGGLRKPTVACLGLAFKPNVDDLRESPALQIVESLAKQGDCTVLAVEPHIQKLPKRLADAQNVEFATLEDAVQDSDLIVILVKHRIFEEHSKLIGRKSEKILDFVNALGSSA